MAEKKTLPLKHGRTHLAYITEEEEKILRDLFHSKETDPEVKYFNGVPVLERDDPEYISGTPEYKARMAQEAESRRKKAAGWKYHGGDEYTGWVAPGKHQSDPNPAAPKTTATKTATKTAATKTAATKKSTGSSTKVTKPTVTVTPATKTSAQTTATQYPKTAETYVENSPDLAQGWKVLEDYLAGVDVNTKYADQAPHPAGLTVAQQAEYWVKRGATSKAAFGEAHASEDEALKSGTYKGATKYKVGSDPWKELFTTKPGQFGTEEFFPGDQSTADAPKTRWDMFDPQATTTTQGDPLGDKTKTNNNIIIDDPNIQPMQMAELTDEMDLTNKLREIINKDSPLFKAAATRAMQAMQRRGIVNSTLAQESVMNAIMNVALPIAKYEVDQLVTNLYYNTDWTNKQKMQANEFAYNKMLTQLQGQINYTLQQLVGSQKESLQKNQIKADLWSTYGNWITTMATTPGADQAAWQRMLDLLQGSGGWPKPT